MEIVKDTKEADPNQVKNPKKVEYDPNKKYTWKPTDTFYISGGEFGVVLNALRAILNTKEAQTILLAERANEVIESTFSRAVESGIVVEAQTNDKTT